MRSVKGYVVGTALFIALFDIHLAVPILLSGIGLIPILKELKPLGFVYVLKADKFYKIGVTSGKVEDRVKELQTGSAKTIKIVHTISTPDPFTLEKQLHKQFAKKRKRGEWFDLTTYDIRKLKAL